MSKPGVGYLINAIFRGNEESVNAAKSSYGKTIAALENGSHNGEEALIFTFADGAKMVLWDDARSCCESRYLHTDDDLSSVIGAKLVELDVREGGAKDDDDGSHEWAFLHIVTDKATVVVETHNEHNGYYGGIDLRCEFITDD